MIKLAVGLKPHYVVWLAQKRVYCFMVFFKIAFQTVSSLIGGKERLDKKGKKTVLRRKEAVWGARYLTVMGGPAEWAADGAWGCQTSSPGQAMGVDTPFSASHSHPSPGHESCCCVGIGQPR